MVSVKKPLIEAAFGRKPSRTPVWFLRQAGRYLPEYRAVRANMSFVELCQSPEKAAEVTLQPLKRFDLDAAIIFSDILIPPMALGQDLSFGAGHGPILKPAIRSREDFVGLNKTVEVERQLGFVGEAIALTKAGFAPHQTMIGFAGAPFTVASYMIEGQGTKTFTEIKTMLYSTPELFSDILERLVDVTVPYLQMQIKAGAEALMLFDTWVGNITCQDYRQHVYPHVQRLFAELRQQAPEVPLIYYPGQGSELYTEITGLALDVVAVDWRLPLERAIEKLGLQGVDVSVQGNLDPQLLMAPEEVLQQRVKEVWQAGQQARGHIFNVGHGLLPHLNPDKLAFVVDTIRSISPEA